MNNVMFLDMNAIPFKMITIDDMKNFMFFEMNAFASSQSMFTVDVTIPVTRHDFKYWLHDFHHECNWVIDDNNRKTKEKWKT
jgi:hypothetical protein